MVNGLLWAVNLWQIIQVWRLKILWTLHKASFFHQVEKLSSKKTLIFFFFWVIASSIIWNLHGIKIKTMIAWNMYLLFIRVQTLWYYSYQPGRWTYEKKFPCKIKLMFHSLVLPKHDSHSTLLDSYKSITVGSTF